jgi:hypothetical protein
MRLTYIELKENSMSFQDKDEQRQCQRSVRLNTIRFSFVDDSPWEIRLGTTLNISTTGMCLYTLHHLAEGENIVLQDDELSLFRKATVRWVKRYRENFCKAGLMYIQ